MVLQDYKHAIGHLQVERDKLATTIEQNEAVVSRTKLDFSSVCYASAHLQKEYNEKATYLDGQVQLKSSQFEGQKKLLDELLDYRNLYIQLQRDHDALKEQVTKRDADIQKLQGELKDRMVENDQIMNQSQRMTQQIATARKENVALQQSVSAALQETQKLTQM